MKFKTIICPHCQQEAKGIIESVQGVALINLYENGDADYAGETDVDWDTQQSVRSERGQYTLVCPQGHDWLSYLEDDPDPPPGCPEDYFVVWRIEVSASSPQDAAEQAFSSMIDDKSTATVFDVFGPTPEEKSYQVDLRFDEAKALIIDLSTGQTTQSPL